MSADGTRIGFECVGSGPGLVLVQGAMGTAETFRELAEALAGAFTVILPDRRGRGRSPHRFSPGYTIGDDVADLDAVLEATGARYVFGLSSGGDIGLHAALALPRIERLALFEPAIIPDGVPEAMAARFARYSAASDLAGMMVIGMKVGELGPGILRALPDRVVKPAVGLMLRRDAAMAELAAAFRYDFAIVESMDGAVPGFAAITQPVLLLGGSESPAYLGRSLDRLEQVIPDVRRVELAGLDHAAAWNREPRRNPHGDPAAVAEQLRAFFSAPAPSAGPA